MNVQDVITRVKRSFGDEAGVQISDQDILRWINDAQEEVALSNQGLMETIGSADTVANQSEYDVPEDFATLRSLRYKNRRVRSMSLAEFNENIDPVDPSTGDPEIFTVWNNKITLYPTPGSDEMGSLSIYYIRHPLAVATIADELNLPLSYHNAIVSYCLQQAYELDEDFNRAQAKQTQFTDTMMKLNDRNKWGSQEYYPRITVLPEDEDLYG